MIYFYSSKIGLGLMLLLLLLAILFVVSLLVLVRNVRVEPFGERRNTLRAFTRPQRPILLMENAFYVSTRPKILLMNEKGDAKKTKKIEFKAMDANII